MISSSSRSESAASLSRAEASRDQSPRSAFLLRLESPLPRLMPPLTAPPLRLLAPYPNSLASMTTTAVPAPEFQCGGKAGIACAHDGNVGLRRQVGAAVGAGRPGLPPIGQRFEVRMKDGAAHRHILRAQILPPRSVQSTSITVAPRPKRCESRRAVVMIRI